ncbi:MAG: hypothetical protein KGM42_00330 [Hyphomicrobiales bacterium]|nr:hypothetical protein [Hyphomicrobiales bacterium]
MMRFLGTILGLLIAFAVALLPSASYAHIGIHAPEAAVATQPSADNSVVSMGMSTDILTPADDCCACHNKAGDPCQSAACCTAHCAGVAAFFETRFVQFPAPTHLLPLISDQVLSLHANSPPFRPPRV